MMAEVRREMAASGSASGGRALVARRTGASHGHHRPPHAPRLPGGHPRQPRRGRAAARAGPLRRRGHHAGPAGPGRESLYQRLGRLSPEARRRVFLVLVGDEFKTGDGTQAWAALADLVIQSRDVAGVDNVLLNTLAERTRLYQVFLDARRRFEESTG